MGRGLSTLQQQLLQLAYANHVREQIPPPTYDVEVELPLWPGPPADDPPDDQDAFRPYLEGLHAAAWAALQTTLTCDGLPVIAWNAATVEPMRLADQFASGKRALVRGWLAQGVPGAEAQALEAQARALGYAATAYHVEMRPDCAHAVVILAAATIPDIRTRAPEAFPPAWPDGFWNNGALWFSWARTPRDCDPVLEALQARGLTGWCSSEWPTPGDLSFQDALRTCFGCAELPVRWAVSPRTPPPGFPRAVLARHQGRLSVAHTGAARYRAAAASLSRACERLVTRGLAVRLGHVGWSGRWRPDCIALTESGLTLAEQLSVNSRDNVPSVNR